VTDYLDGYLARKLNMTSKLGAFLDPVADKLMVSTALVLLVHTNLETWQPKEWLLIKQKQNGKNLHKSFYLANE
jgi:phosphatidylglycerophosphate synthase